MRQIGATYRFIQVNGCTALGIPVIEPQLLVFSAGGMGLLKPRSYHA
jgi:hypothetical protein